MHWVAVISEIYFDDSRKYKIRAYEECIENLEGLIFTEDSKSSTGEMEQSGAVENISNTNPYVVENLLNTSAVHNAEALGIPGGGDDIEETSVDHEGSESEEEEDTETTVIG